MRSNITYHPYSAQFAPPPAAANDNAKLGALSMRVAVGELPREVLDAEVLTYAFRDASFLDRSLPLQLPENAPCDNPAEIFKEGAEKASGPRRSSSRGATFQSDQRGPNYEHAATLESCVKYKARAEKITGHNIATGNMLIDLLTAARRLQAISDGGDVGKWIVGLERTLDAWGVDHLPANDNHHQAARNHIGTVSHAWLPKAWRPNLGYSAATHDPAGDIRL